MKAIRENLDTIERCIPQGSEAHYALVEIRVALLWHTAANNPPPKGKAVLVIQEGTGCIGMAYYDTQWRILTPDTGCGEVLYWTNIPEVPNWIKEDQEEKYNRLERRPCHEIANTVPS